MRWVRSRSLGMIRDRPWFVFVEQSCRSLPTMFGGSALSVIDQGPGSASALAL